VRLGEIPLEIQVCLLMLFSNFPFTRNGADDLAKADIMLEACAPSTIPYPLSGSAAMIWIRDPAEDIIPAVVLSSHEAYPREQTEHEYSSGVWGLKPSAVKPIEQGVLSILYTDVRDDR